MIYIYRKTIPLLPNLTSAISGTNIREAPDIAEAHGVAETGEKKFQLPRPVPSLNDLVLTVCLGLDFGALQVLGSFGFPHGLSVHYCATDSETRGKLITRTAIVTGREMKLVLYEPQV